MNQKSIKTPTLTVLLWLLCGPTAQAQVATCDALNLYGNAVREGLCKGLSPGNQNLWVCDLTGGSPDIHTTFNAVTNLHVTVRHNPAPPNCQGQSQLTGLWPAGLAIMAGQPGMVCQVNIQNYVNRLNAVAQAAPMLGQTLCRSSFLRAQAAGKLSPTNTAQYLANCAANACP
ncbi:hypothetical protein [Marinicella meishanensis]|uniref:hypothetical protein n=1 Tax=Marinicella meishanensis TaxID=2873263 RepID=UPI001CBF2CB0|nr:hypothetical protein [Marinicella sp. NBU2979]